MSIFRSFRRSQSGNVAVMFAVSLVPLFGMAGAAIDYSRVTQVQGRLGDALDAALLAAASQPAMTDKQLYDAVKVWMNVHMDSTAARSWQLDSVTQKDGSMVGIASADVDMTISRIIGVDHMPVTVKSEAMKSLGKIELAFVLDNTGSMKGTKIATLKTAATELVDSLAAATKNPADLRIGLVPFSQTVNVGPQYSGAAWLDAGGNSAAAKSLFAGQTVNRIDLFKKVGATWGGCVETRAQPYESGDPAADPKKADSLYVPYFAPDEPGAKGPGTYNNSYLKDSSLSAIKTALKALGLPTSLPDFQLLQGDIAKYTGTPYSGTTNTLGYKYGANSGCEIAPLLRLSTDTKAVKTAINAMIANGNTDIPVGLTWGWNVLAPAAGGVFGDGLAYNTADWTKIVVLMTDGNNENNEGNSEDTSFYSGIGYTWQGRMGVTSATKAKRTELRDQRLADICTAMKAGDRNIVIYTVRVEVKTGSSAVLQNCATDKDKFYDVQDVSQLIAVFNEIGGQIQKLRLAR